MAEKNNSALNLSDARFCSLVNLLRMPLVRRLLKEFMIMRMFFIVNQ